MKSFLGCPDLVCNKIWMCTYLWTSEWQN